MNFLANLHRRHGPDDRRLGRYRLRLEGGDHGDCRRRARRRNMLGFCSAASAFEGLLEQTVAGA